MSGQPIATRVQAHEGSLTRRPEQRRFVGDPSVTVETHREACLYGAAMIRKVGRLPSDMTAIDVLFRPPATLIFISADEAQAELAQYVIPTRVLTYQPKAVALPPSQSEVA